MADIEVLKEKLKNSFNEYVAGYIQRLGTVEGSDFTVDSPKAKEKYGTKFIIPKIDEGDSSPGTGSSSPVLTTLFPKPEKYDPVSYNKGIRQMRDGMAKPGSWIKDVPGWSQYFDALSSVRNVGYTVIFHSHGLSQYAKTKAEYTKYVDDLRSNPNFGNETVNELLKYGWLTDPATYSPGIEWDSNNSGPEFTRDEQEKRISLMLWHWKNAKDIFAFIENYRWFPSKTPPDQKKADDDNIKAWKDRYKGFSSETIDAYGTVDPNGNMTAVSSKFKTRYAADVFYTAVDVLYAVETELQVNNPNYSGDLFKELVDADKIIRRKRALEKLRDNDGKVKEKLWNDFWAIIIENYNKFIAESEKGPKKGYMRDPKTGDYVRDNSGQRIIQEISADMWIEQVLSGTADAFIKALSVGKMNPRYRAWRTDPGGIPAVQFEWYPDPEILRELYILMAFKSDPDRANRIIYPTTPIKKGSDESDDRKGIFRKIFGESVGFKSGESPTSTRGKERAESKIETSIENPALNDESRPNPSSGIFSQKDKGEGTSSTLAANPVGNESDIKSSTVGGTGSELGSANTGSNITNNVINQSINSVDQASTINTQLNAPNSQENKDLTINNESNALSGGETNNLNVNNINDLSQTGGSNKSEDLTQVNKSETNINDASSRSINNSALNTESLTGGNQSSSTSVTNLNPLVSNSSINSNRSESNSGSSNSVTNMNTESKGSEINIDRKQISVSNVQSSNVKSESLTARSENTPAVTSGDVNSSTVNNVTNQNEGAQTAGNVTNNTDNSMSKTPIIQNNIDMSEMISRLKRIEEALLSPLEVKVIDA